MAETTAHFRVCLDAVPASVRLCERLTAEPERLMQMSRPGGPLSEYRMQPSRPRPSADCLLRAYCAEAPTNSIA